MTVLSSSILCDLGVTSRQNILIDSTLFNNSISDIDFSHRGSPGLVKTRSNINEILANMTAYNLPLRVNQTSHFNTQYMCSRMSWKPRAELLIDVCVATASFFMVFWGVLKLGLAFFARRASVNGKRLFTKNLPIEV